MTGERFHGGVNKACHNATCCGRGQDVVCVEAEFGHDDSGRVYQKIHARPLSPPATHCNNPARFFAIRCK